MNTLDAVNVNKGKWVNYTGCTGAYFASNSATSYWYFGSLNPDYSDLDFVCTREEFEQQVLDCTNNVGFNMNKNDIDWAKADENATHWDTKSDVFCAFAGYWLNSPLRFISHHNPINLTTDRYIARPVEAETKVYWDGKEELKVGMYVTYKPNNDKFLTLKRKGDVLKCFEIKDQLALLCADNFSFATIANSAWYEPVDTRTAKEIKVDNFLNLFAPGFLICESSAKAALMAAHDEWVGDKS